MGQTWGSFVHAGGRLYVTSTNGETVVLKADPQARRAGPEQAARSRCWRRSPFRTGTCSFAGTSSCGAFPSEGPHHAYPPRPPDPGDLPDAGLLR